MSQVDEISARIKDILLREGLSTHALARKVGVTGPCVQKWVHGKAVPNGRDLIKIEQATGIPPDWILYGHPPYKRTLLQSE